MILEDRTNAILKPTLAQKTVLAKAKASESPQVAASEVSKGRNLVVARDMLVRLGLLTMRDNKVSVTAKGEEIMRNQNLLDDIGALTSAGQKLAYDGQVKESLLKSINQLSCS